MSNERSTAVVFTNATVTMLAAMRHELDTDMQRTISDRELATAYAAAVATSRNIIEKEEVRKTIGPCPFCACIDDPKAPHTFWVYGNAAAVKCGNCGALGPNRPFIGSAPSQHDLKEAADAWNERPVRAMRKRPV